MKRKPHEFRWKIDAYTAETMPLDRLAEYMTYLAAMLGEPQHLHLIKVETGSTSAVLRVDGESVERVRQRGQEIRRGIAPRDAMEGYRNINRLLREDNGAAALYEGDAEIIPFPGAQEEVAESVSGIQQQGSLDGQLLRVGGEKPWVPVQLLTPEAKITGCYAKRTLAKKMGSHLFEPVRLYGRGRWTRTPAGQWHLDRFWIDEFDSLSSEPLPAVVNELRRVKSDWRANPVADILKDENEQ